MKPIESSAEKHQTLGDLLRSIRLGDENSQADFARRLGISQSHLRDLEKGRTTVSLRRATQFARTLGGSEALFARLALQTRLHMG